MKVAILTINDHINIGNRLQNYAVQEFLKEHGLEPNTLIFASYDDEAGSVSKLKTLLKNILVKCNVFTSDFYIKHIKKSKKMLLVKRFNKEHVKSSKKYFFANNCPKKCEKEFDYFCAGSDQVWNAALVQNRGLFFMQFAAPEKTFSFAASMGTTYINPKYVDNYQRGFKHVGNISVRETDAQQLIKEMTGRDVSVILDPTLLIDKDKWLNISKKPDLDLPEKYIVTYFLGAPTSAQKNFIDEYAKKNGCAVIDINQTYYDSVGPLEYLYLIANSEFMFTDSFHGTAFSIIFKKNFLVFQRNNSYDMSSRITTILQKFKLENRLYNGDNKEIPESLNKLIEDIKCENTDQIDSIISDERKFAGDFINTVLSKD